MLSKEEAIIKHRDMWNWIADRIKERKQLVDVGNLKQDYIEQHNESVLYNCYMCEYCMSMLEVDEDSMDRCKYCPLDWKSYGDECGLYQCLDNNDEMGLYRKADVTAVWEEQYELCKKIANLKERKVYQCQ